MMTWAAPDAVRSMTPDGKKTVTLFTAFRVWAMGVNHAGTKRLRPLFHRSGLPENAVKSPIEF